MPAEIWTSTWKPERSGRMMNRLGCFFNELQRIPFGVVGEFGVPLRRAQVCMSHQLADGVKKSFYISLSFCYVYLFVIKEYFYIYFLIIADSANLFLTQNSFTILVDTLSPYPLLQKKHVHKSPLGEVSSRTLRGSFRPVGSPNGGSTPYCGYDLRNGTPEIMRCFLGMLAAA